MCLNANRVSNPKKTIEIVACPLGNAKLVSCTACKTGRGLAIKSFNTYISAPVIIEADAKYNASFGFDFIKRNTEIIKDRTIIGIVSKIIPIIFEKFSK